MCPLRVLACVTAFLPHARDISPLQCTAFEKDGTRIVAVLNFREKGEAFFDLKADAAEEWSPLICPQTHFTPCADGRILS